MALRQWKPKGTTTPQAGCCASNLLGMACGRKREFAQLSYQTTRQGVGPVEVDMTDITWVLKGIHIAKHEA